MMGHTHALSGALAWLAAVPLVTSEHLIGSYAVTLSPAQVAAGTVVCAGAAMLPDMDHHDGTIANTYGVFTRVLCKWIGKISGGHRHATHSILFALGVGYGVDWLATHFVYGWWAALFLIMGLGIRSLGVDFEKYGFWSEVADALLAAAAVWLMHGLDMSFIGYAVTLGCLAHVAGDCLTPRGCPVFWPAPWTLEIPLVPRTDGKVERWVIAPLLTVGIAILAVRSILGEVTARWLNTG